MNKKYLLVGGIVLAAIVGLLIFSRPITTEKQAAATPNVIRSVDGVIALEIPNDALPEGQDPSLIAVEALESEAFWGSKEDAPGPSYKLVPDGLVFTKPITMRTTAKSDGVLPQVFHVSKGETELITPDTVRMTADGNIEAEFALTHFSDIGLDLRHGTFRYEFTSGGSAQVGQTLPFEVNITVNQQEQYFMRGVGWSPDVARLLANAKKGKGFREAEREYRLAVAANLGGYFYQVAPGTVYTVAAFDVTNSGNVLMPTTLHSAEKEQKEYQPFHYAAQFTCTNPGTTTPHSDDIDINYRMRKRQHLEGTSTGEGVSYENSRTKILMMPKSYTCLAAPVEPDQDKVRAGSDINTNATPTKPSTGGTVIVCGLPGGPPCPKRP